MHSAIVTDIISKCFGQISGKFNNPVPGAYQEKVIPTGEDGINIQEALIRLEQMRQVKGEKCIHLPAQRCKTGDRELLSLQSTGHQHTQIIDIGLQNPQRLDTAVPLSVFPKDPRFGRNMCEGLRRLFANRFDQICFTFVTSFSFENPIVITILFPIDRDIAVDELRRNVLRRSTLRVDGNIPVFQKLTPSGHLVQAASQKGDLIGSEDRFH